MANVDRLGCIFCENVKDSADEKNYIVLRGKSCFIMMNAFPYNNGHIMIAPFRHVERTYDLTEAEWLETFDLLNRSLRAIEKTMRPDGFNVGVNLGRPAGAGFDHLHVHVVPRWSGDTSFMPVLADTKIISEHLDATYRRLRSALS